MATNKDLHGVMESTGRVAEIGKVCGEWDGCGIIFEQDPVGCGIQLAVYSE